MEEFRHLAITNLSAENLKDVRHIFKMKVYAIISITGDPFMALGTELVTTPVDYEGEANPSWNTPINFTLHNPSLQNNHLQLNIHFRCQRSLGNRIVGQVTVPVKHLFSMMPLDSNTNTSQPIECPVIRPSGRVQGCVKFSFTFGQPFSQLVRQPPVQPPPPVHRRTNFHQQNVVYMKAQRKSADYRSNDLSGQQESVCEGSYYQANSTVIIAITMIMIMLMTMILIFKTIRTDTVCMW